MRTFILIGLILLSSCNSQKKVIDGVISNETNTDDIEISQYPTLMVTKIENSKDGYIVQLIDEGKMTYTMKLNTPNLKENKIALKVWDKVKIKGDYAESVPVQIYAKEIIIILPNSQ